MWKITQSILFRITLFNTICRQNSITQNQNVKIEDVKTQYLKAIPLNQYIVEQPRQSCITKDNVEIMVYQVARVKITNPILAVYQIHDVYEAIQILTQTTIRSILGTMNLDDILQSRDEIQLKAHQDLQLAFNSYGVELIDIDILDIDPSQQVVTAMQQQVIAERNRRTAIIQADGKRHRAIVETEGKNSAQKINQQAINQAKLIQAEYNLKAKQVLAESQAESLQKLKDNGVKDPGKFTVKMQWYDSLKNIILKTKKLSINIKSKGKYVD